MIRTFTSRYPEKAKEIQYYPDLNHFSESLKDNQFLVNEKKTAVRCQVILGKNNTSVEKIYWNKSARGEIKTIYEEFIVTYNEPNEEVAKTTPISMGSPLTTVIILLTLSCVAQLGLIISLFFR